MIIKMLGSIKKINQRFIVIFKIIDIRLINLFLDLKVEKEC